MTTTYRCIGKGVTDENGVAHMTHSTSDGGSTWTDISSNPGYVGTGKGLVDLCASPDAPADISSSSVQSGTFSLLDCLKYDKGILNDPDTHDIYSNTTTDALTRTSEYTRLKEVTSGTDVRTEIASLPSEFTMDFDFYQVDGSNGNGIMNLYDSNGNYLNYFALSLISEPTATWLRLRLTVTENSATLTNLDNTSHTVTQTFTGTVSKLRLVTGSSMTEIRWKNVKIYP